MPGLPTPPVRFLLRVCRHAGARRLDAFGSAVRDDFDPATSDLDFLVELDEVAPASFGCGVAWTRNVRRPCRLASGLSAVRTLIPPAQAPSANSAAVVRNCVVRIVFSCGVCNRGRRVAFAPTMPGAGRGPRGRQSHCGVVGWARGHHGTARRRRSRALRNPEHNCAELYRLVECFSKRRRDSGV